MKPDSSPGTKASVVFYAFFAATGFVLLAVFGASGVVPALAGSLFIAGPLALVAYVVFVRSDNTEDVS